MSLIADEINRSSKEYGLKPEILAALVMQESTARTLAVRYEPAFFRRYIEKQDPFELPGYFPGPNDITSATEKNLRSMSFGLCQIMGETAREFGYRGTFLTGLLDPVSNIQLAAKILASYIRQKNFNLEAGLLRYNGGGDPNYPDKVLSRTKLEATKALLK